MAAIMNKIACNATNSAAVDNAGNLYVWGSTRYGLCGDVDPLGGTAKKKDGVASKAPDGKAGPAKSACVTEPRQLTLLPADYLHQGKEEVKSGGQGPQEEFFSAFHLLDPDPSRSEQVFCAQHISFGSYHAGVVCDDISTNYPFTPVP